MQEWAGEDRRHFSCSDCPELKKTIARLDENIRNLERADSAQWSELKDFRKLQYCILAGVIASLLTQIITGIVK